MSLRDFQRFYHRFYHCCDKHHDWKQVGEKMVYFILQLPGHNLSLKEVGAGIKADGGGEEGILLNGSLSMACSVCFLIQFRTTFPGMKPTTVGLSLQVNNLSRKCPPPTYPQVKLMDPVLQLRFFIPRWLEFCVKLTKTNQPRLKTKYYFAHHN